MANKPDNQEKFAVDTPDVEGADSGWDDWDDVADFDVDVPRAPKEQGQDEASDAPEAAADTQPISSAALDAEAEPAPQAASSDVPEAAQGAEVFDVDVVDEDWGDEDWGAEEESEPETPETVESMQAQLDASLQAEENAPEEVEETPVAEEEPVGELEVDEEELKQYLPPEPTPAEEPAPVEEEATEPSSEEQEAALDAALAEPEQQKSEEEIRREQEELEAYRSAMGESNAELADVSEYRTFRKKTKTESKSSVPKKSDFDLFANRYKVKTMNAMVAASDPIVYFYNACLRADGSILAFNVYQVLQDRFLGKMVPQLFTAVAENSAKIEELNEANLIEQLKVCAEYPQYDFIISVSARFFTKPALLERFLKLIPEGGVPNLVLAFDCSSLENIAIAAKAGLGTVRQKGVKILLDNTERVTMTVLSEFDYDIIRIDSRYYEIGNPRAEAYLRLLLQLTKEQGVTSIATFCDSEDLSEYMFFMGVDAIQGNATSRPMRTVPNAVKGIVLLPSMLD